MKTSNYQAFPSSAPAAASTTNQVINNNAPTGAFNHQLNIVTSPSLGENGLLKTEPYEQASFDHHLRQQQDLYEQLQQQPHGKNKSFDFDLLAHQNGLYANGNNGMIPTSLYTNPTSDSVGNILEFQPDQTSDRHYSGPSVSGGSSLESTGSAGHHVFTPNAYPLDEDPDQLGIELNPILSNLYQNNNSIKGLKANNGALQLSPIDMYSLNDYGTSNPQQNNNRHHHYNDLNGAFYCNNNSHNGNKLTGQDCRRNNNPLHDNSNEMASMADSFDQHKHTGHQRHNGNVQVIQNGSGNSTSFTSPESAFYQYQNRMEAQLCQVCGESAAGFHHGAYVCEACKKFFMRHSLTDSKLQTACPTGGKCSVTKGNRGKCQQCRFKKCLEIGMFLKDPDSQNDVDISNIPCRVCGGRSSGFHFGALTCEGCKGFFRRTEGTNTRLVCVGGQDNCSITPRSRNACKSCRFKRCLAVGMSKIGSRIGRQPNAVKYHCAMEIMQIQVMKNVLASSNGQLTVPEASSPMSNNHNMKSGLHHRNKVVYKQEEPDNHVTSYQTNERNGHHNSQLNNATPWTTHYSQSNNTDTQQQVKNLRRRASEISDVRIPTKELRMDQQHFHNIHGHSQFLNDGSFHQGNNNVDQNRSHDYSRDGNTSVEDSFNASNLVGNFDAQNIMSELLLNNQNKNDSFLNNYSNEKDPKAFNIYNLSEVISTKSAAVPASLSCMSEVHETIIKFTRSMTNAVEFLMIPSEYSRTKANLVPIPTKEYANSALIWSHMMNRLNLYSEQVVQFSKLIPGFNQLSLSVRSTLVKEGMYPAILLLLSREFNAQLDVVNYFDFSQDEKAIILHHFPTLNRVSEHLRISGSFVHSLHLTPLELAIFCIMEILKNFSHIKEAETYDSQGLYYLAKHSLLYSMTGGLDETAMKNQRWSQAEALSNLMVAMNTEHHYILFELKKSRNDLDFSELFHEIFQTTYQHETIGSQQSLISTVPFSASSLNINLCQTSTTSTISPIDVKSQSDDSANEDNMPKEIDFKERL